jgi:DNA-binding transcriptional LysR family regulator
MLLEDLKAFCLVCEQNSLAKAARKSGISTPMMTRRIQRMESELQTQLFNRSTRVVKATEAGNLFYQHCIEVINQYDSGVKALQTLSEQVSGTIKIGLPTSISHLWVTRTLKKFLLKYPDVKIQIVNGNHLLGLLAEGFDLVIHCGQLPDSGYYFRKICDWNKLTCAAPDYLKKFGEPEHPCELINHNCVDHYDNFRNTWTYNLKRKPTEFFVQGNIKANSSIDLKNLAVSGQGLVYLPDFSVYEDIKSGNLKIVLDRFQPDKLPMYAVYPSRQSLSKKNLAFLEYLTTLFSDK